MKLNYYLLKVNGYSYIRLRYFFDGKRIDLTPPDISVEEKDWDKNDKENPIKKTDNEYLKKNKKLRDYKQKFEDVIKILKVRNIEPTKENIIFFIKTQESENLHTIKINYPLIDILEKWKKNITNNIAGKSLSYRKTVKSVGGIIIDFLKSKNGLKYKGFEDINRTFFDEYFNYCVEELDYSNDTIKKHIYTFKTFLRWALDEKYHSIGITQYVPKMRKELNENVFLTENEVLTIWNFKECDYVNPKHSKYTTEYLIDNRNNITGKRGGERERILTNWEVVRDMFVFACTTGLRYSDVVRVKVNDYDYYFETLNVTPQKTNKGGVNVRIPMGKENDNILKQIWIKYSSGKSGSSPLFPKTKYGNDYPNQKINKILKDICKVPKLKSQLSRTFVKTYVKGDVIKEDKSGRKHLYDIISFHSGRRTFATRAMKVTNNSEQVKKITGHLSDRIFNRYVGANNEDFNKIKSMWNIKNLSIKDTINKNDNDLIRELERQRSSGEISNATFLLEINKVLLKNE